MHEQGESVIMTTVRGSEAAEERSLTERARRGDRAAFWALYDAHAASAWRLALALRADPVAAGEALVDAFAAVLGPGDQPGRGFPTPLRVQLLAATRGAVIAGDGVHRPAHLAPTDVVAIGTSLSAERERAARGFERLPERWRTVLWLTEVEQLAHRDAGIVLGTSTQSTAQLADRAQAGIREQLAQAQVQEASQPDCQRTARRLGGYVANALSARDAIRVRRHLDQCAACRERLDEVDDLAPRLRRAVPVLPIAVGGAAEQAWAAGTSRVAGPLGLTLPGGRPIPQWAERALTGATAAVITLGITGALLAGGKGGGGRDVGPLARERTEQPLGAGDGESALGTGVDETSGPVEDDDAPVGDQPTHAPPAAPSIADPAAVPNKDAAPPSGAPPTTPTPPTTPPAGPGGPGPTVPPPAPPGSPPPLLSIRLDDGTGVSVGGDCTGLEVLEIVIGCDPPAGTEILPPRLGGLGL